MRLRTKVVIIINQLDGAQAHPTDMHVFRVFVQALYSLLAALLQIEWRNVRSIPFFSVLFEYIAKRHCFACAFILALLLTLNTIQFLTVSY